MQQLNGLEVLREVQWRMLWGFFPYNMRGKAVREAEVRCCLSILHEVVLKPLPYLFVCICSCYNSFGSLLDVQIAHSVILNYVSSTEK